MMDYAELIDENQALGKGELRTREGNQECLTIAIHPPEQLPMTWDQKLVHQMLH